MKLTQGLYHFSQYKVMDFGDICRLLSRFKVIDYTELVPFDLTDGCCDLVTLNQGLHHFPQDKIMDFLAEVLRANQANLL